MGMLTHLMAYIEKGFQNRYTTDHLQRREGIWLDVESILDHLHSIELRGNHPLFMKNFNKSLFCI